MAVFCTTSCFPEPPLTIYYAAVSIQYALPFLTPCLIFVSRLPGKRPTLGLSSTLLLVRLVSLIINSYLWTLWILISAGAIIASSLQDLYVKTNILSWYRFQLHRNVVPHQVQEQVLAIVFDQNEDKTQHSGKSSPDRRTRKLFLTAMKCLVRGTISSISFMYTTLLVASYYLASLEIEPSLLYRLTLLCMPIPIVVGIGSVNTNTTDLLHSFKGLHSIISGPLYQEQSVDSEAEQSAIPKSSSRFTRTTLDEDESWNFVIHKHVRLRSYLLQHRHVHPRTLLGSRLIGVLLRMGISTILLSSIIHLSKWTAHRQYAFRMQNWQQSCYSLQIAVIIIEEVYRLVKDISLEVEKGLFSSRNFWTNDWVIDLADFGGTILALLFLCPIALQGPNDVFWQTPYELLRDPPLREGIQRQGSAYAGSYTPRNLLSLALPSVILVSKLFCHYQKYLEASLDIFIQSSACVRNLNSDKILSGSSLKHTDAALWFAEEITAPRSSDLFKLATENLCGDHIIWWPLTEPNRLPRAGMRKMKWTCTCGSKINFDVAGPQSSQSAISRDRDAFEPEQQDEDTILPMYNSPGAGAGLVTPSSTNVQTSSNTVRSRNAGANQADNKAIPNHVNQSKTTISPAEQEGSFIYWCVNDNNSTTHVTEFIASKHTDLTLIAGLKQQYRRVNGWWHGFWTMTSCAGVSFHKFRYLFENIDVVSIHGPPELPNDKQYQYIRTDPLDEYRAWLESRISHHMRFHSSKSTAASIPENQLLPRIPKKTPDRLTATPYAQGYGMHAVSQLSLFKVLIMLFVWQGGSIAFVIYWLCAHGGDLQNAFTVLATTIAGFVLYLEVLIRFRT